MTNKPLVHSRTVTVKIHTKTLTNPIHVPVTASDNRHEVARNKLMEIRKNREDPDAYAEIITTELVA